MKPLTQKLLMGSILTHSRREDGSFAAHSHQPREQHVGKTLLSLNALID